MALTFKIFPTYTCLSYTKFYKCVSSLIYSSFSASSFTFALVRAHTPEQSLPPHTWSLPLVCGFFGPRKLMSWIVLIKDLFWTRSSLLREEQVCSIKVQLQGNATSLKCKWVLVHPLFATTKIHCGKSPSNLLVWITSKWADYVVSFFFFFF